MEQLSDDQLETVFQICDADQKGFITALDLHALNSDPEILSLLKLDPEDELSLRDFIRRVRGIADAKNGTKKFLEAMDGTRASPEPENLRGDGTTCKTEPEVDRTIVFSNSPLTKMPRFLTSSRAALSTRSRESDTFSPTSIGDDREMSISTTLSTSLQDLTGKFNEFIDSQLHCQDEIQNMLSRMSTSMQLDNDRRMDQLLSLVDERLSILNSDPEEDRHMRCQIEQLESEKRSRDVEICSLRDRILELSQCVELKDDEINRERRLNEELRQRFSLANQEIQSLKDDRATIKHSNMALRAKLENMFGEMDGMKAEKEVLAMERLQVERDKANLAYEFRRLASDRERLFNQISGAQMPIRVSSSGRISFSIEDDFSEGEAELEPLRRPGRQDGEVMSEVLDGFFESGMRREDQNDFDESDLHSIAKNRSRRTTKRRKLPRLTLTRVRRFMSRNCRFCLN